jgi:outer membrane protein assembly factor BamB
LFRFLPALPTARLTNRSTIVALDAATGKEIWSHPNTGLVAQRGINYWESKDGSDRRLFFINDGYLTAIDARTGKGLKASGTTGGRICAWGWIATLTALCKPAIRDAFSKT